MNHDLEQRIKKARNERYAALRNLAPDLYRRAVETADGIAINHGLSTKVAAEIEHALVVAYMENL
jgi:hypothetical protein